MNTRCLHKNPEGLTHCYLCGSQLIIDGRLRATRLLSKLNIFSPPEAKAFEAVNLQTKEKIILRVVHSDSWRLKTSLLESVLGLRQIHLLKTNPGVMQLTEKEGYFTWQILPGEPESHFMTTHLVEGIPLDEWIGSLGVINEETAVDWLRYLVESADALHREGFVHQDINPGNIIFGDDYSQPVLIDLGAIRFINPSRSMNPDICRGTAEYPVVGTPGYEAPEQSQGRPNHTSDYYSIGRTLIYLLTGVQPADLPTLKSGKLVWQDKARVSAPLADLIDRLVEPNQLYRPSTAKAILDYLNELPTPHEVAKQIQSKYRLRGRATKLGFLACVIIGFSLAGAGSALQSTANVNRLFSESNQLIYTGVPGQAIPLLEEAIKIKPEAADVRATLALAYALSGDRAAAIESYTLALASEPDNPIIHYNLAYIYEEDDRQIAIEHYQIAAAEGSLVRDDAVNNLARIYLLENQLDNARKLLEQTNPAEDQITQAALLKNLGWLQFEQGDLGRSLESLKNSVELNPTRPDAYCLMAIIQRQQEKPSRDDEITCLSLPTPEDRPEVQRWKMQLLGS